MGLFQVIYPSRLFGFDTGIPSKILLDARRLNARDDRTGALICRADSYLQLLEGPEAPVRQTMERIKRDDRHLEVKMHGAEMVPERMFGAWAMLHDPAATWIWSQKEIAGGAVDQTTPTEITSFFARLRGEMEAGTVD